MLKSMEEHDEKMKTIVKSLKQQWAADHQKIGMLEQQLARKDAKIARLEKLLDSYETQDRQQHDLSTYNTSGNVKIFMRVRPSGLNEANEAFSTSLAPAPKMKKVTLGHPPKDYKFDRVFGPSCTREEILEDMKPIIRSALDGFHVFVFAYGKIPSY